MAGYSKSVGLVGCAGLIWLAGYLSATLPSYKVPYGQVLWDDNIFTEFWYGCDAVAKVLMTKVIVLYSRTFKQQGLYYISMCLHGWAIGNLADELFFDPTKIHNSELYCSAIFAMICLLQYLDNNGWPPIQRIKNLFRTLRWNTA